MGLKAVSRTITGAPDYEVGTWTPVLEGTTVAGSHVYANQGGRFVRFANLVWATGVAALSNFDIATSGAMIISGLPFVGASGSHNANAFCLARSQNVNLDSAGGYYFPLVTMPGGVSFLQLVQFGDGVPDKSITAADFTNATAIRVTGVYAISVPSIGP